MGLVNAVAPKAALDALVRETVDRIAANAPLTLRAAKITARELAQDPARRDTAAHRRRGRAPATRARTTARACARSWRSASRLFKGR